MVASKLRRRLAIPMVLVRVLGLPIALLLLLVLVVGCGGQASKADSKADEAKAEKQKSMDKTEKQEATKAEKEQKQQTTKADKAEKQKTTMKADKAEKQPTTKADKAQKQEAAKAEKTQKQKTTKADKASSPTQPGATNSQGSFSDPLTSPPHPDESDESLGGCHFEADGLHASADAGTCPVDAPKFDDAEVAVTVKSLRERPEARFGLVLDDGDPLNEKHIFRVTTEESFNFIVADPLEDVLLEGSSPAINRGNGSVNDLRVRIEGPHLEFFVNEAKVGEADLEKSFSGSVDLFSYGGGEFVFSDLVVEPI